MRDTDPLHIPAIRLIGDSPVPVWGLNGAERLIRTLKGFGMTDIAAWPAPYNSSPSAVLIDAGFLIEDHLLRKLIASPGKYLPDPVSGRIAAAHVMAGSASRIAELIVGNHAAAMPGLPGDAALTPLPLSEAEDYSHEVKKRITAFIMPITADTKGRIERHLFDAVYKGVTDIVTKYVWPWPAYHVTRACAAIGVTPNMVTSVSAALTVLAYILFSHGQFGWGLAAAWGMTFLDTVDGKLARVTVNSSPFGNIFDHGLDLIHPPFWYWAWIAGIGAAGGHLWQGDSIAAIVIIGYVAQRLQEGAFKLFFGITLHVWRPFDSRFRLINARRNPNLVILMAGALLGRPDIGMIMVAVWTLVCIGVHFVQIAQATALRFRREPVRSWLAT
ncbi:MAG: CDP-alcohol phosphatidyltransferase family protein [Alphaproteobacteria bacterium]